MRYLILFLLVTMPLYAKTFTVQGTSQHMAGDPESPVMQPRWSPNGKFIAMTGDNYSGIQLYHLDDQHVSSLTSDRAAGFGLSWSPDGETLVSRVARFDNKRRLNARKLYEINQKNDRIMLDYTPVTPGLPAWNADGSAVLALVNDEVELFAVSDNPTVQRTLPESPIPLLDGDKMVIVRGSDTGDRIVKTQTRSRILNAVLSPDGEKIAYEVYGGSMHVMNIDGLNDVDLGPGFRPRWHPDSQHLVYMITQDDGHRITESDLYTIRIDGQDKTRLQFSENRLEMNPDWSPDGLWIAYDVSDLGAVYRVEVQSDEEVNP